MDDLVLPLTQSEAFERTCRALGLPVRRFRCTGRTCLVQSRKLPAIGPFHLASRGPVFREGRSDADWMKEIRAELKGPLIVNAPLGVRPRGGLRILAGAELSILDLKAPEEMRRNLQPKWRNQLKKAEASPLRVITEPLDATLHGWFNAAEQVQQRQRGYRSYPASFLQAFAAANPGQAQLYAAMLGDDPAAAMLVLKHGRMATYQAGVTTPMGREHCAHNLLLWHIMSDLQREGLSQLDLGRADLSAGLRRFKTGTGARVETLPGTFLLHAWLPGSGRSVRRGPPNRDAAPGIAP